MTDWFSIPVEKYWDFAKKYTPEQKAEEIRKRINGDEYIASLKKDGYYCRFVKQEGESRMQSRSISTVTGTYGEHRERLPHLFPILNKLPEGTVLIGELYYQGKGSHNVGEILQCKPEKAVERQEGAYGYLTYYVHDVWRWAGVDLMKVPYETRIKTIEENLPKAPFIEKPTYARTPQEIADLLNYAFDNDEEGIVMVRKNSTVDPGKRTAWKTIKVKRELDQEVDCFTTGRYKEATKLYTGSELPSWRYWEDMRTGIKKEGLHYEDYEEGALIEPVTKPYFMGWAGSLELGLFKNNEIVILGYVSGVTEDIKSEIVSNTDLYRLRPCTVTGMEFTADHKIRHPRFVRWREDLSASQDCLWEKVFEN